MSVITIKQEGQEGPGTLTLDRRFLRVPFFSLLYVQQVTPGRSKSEGFRFKM